MKHYYIAFLIFISTTVVFSQNDGLTSKLFETYEVYKENNLDKRRVKFNDVQALINRLKSNSKYTIQKVGESIEGRDLTLISIGSGKTNVFLWSQMHGDEPTATQAIFDIFNFLNSNDYANVKEEILNNLTLHFLPMLNPDGAELFTRRNALGIDINRDALRLQSPEGRTLKKVRDSLNADFGFNLHDQSTYYNTELTANPATISYLAPAYNYEKDINDVRGNAMKVIVFMNSIIQKYAPGQVGRYNDAFEPRAFGDNIQKWGTSTILIESGGFKNDKEKQQIRKLNYVSILSAIYTIAKENYKNIPISAYEDIPHNDRKLFDLKIVGATYNLLNKQYIIDIGINHLEIDNDAHTNYYNVGRVIDQGDLSTYFGYQTFDAKNYKVVPGKVYSETLNSMEDIEAIDVYELLKSGITYIRIKNLPKEIKEESLPINLISVDYKILEFRINVGVNPTFLLKKDTIEYAVINGFLINLSSKKNNFRNSIIYR